MSESQTTIIGGYPKGTCKFCNEEIKYEHVSLYCPNMGSFRYLNSKEKAHWDCYFDHSIEVKMKQGTPRELMEEHKIPENMKIFFEKLLELKAFVKEESERCHDACYSDTYSSEILDNVYERLDAIIKEKK